MKVSLVIPAMNEEGCLSRFCPEIAALNFHEVIVVDGHSSDNTVAVAKQFGFITMTQPGRGYGDAVRAGYARATGDVIAMLDADGSQDPADFPKMVRGLSDGYDMVIGTRYAPGGMTHDDTPVRALGNWLFTRAYNLLFWQNLTDSLYVQCVFRRELLEKMTLEANDFSLCIELTVKAAMAGAKIGEVPCHERGRYDGESKVHALWDGFRILGFMLKLRASR